MITARFFRLLAWAALFDSLMIGTGFAAFGFGGDDALKSGLDFTTGYDVNTVYTVSGRVTALPRTGSRKHAILEIRTAKERLYLYVGPPSYWNSNGIAVNIDDVIFAKGSRAQGKDGKTYLITQKLVNRTTGAHLDLRDARGGAAWSNRRHKTLHD
jgi:hypothetical protein